MSLPYTTLTGRVVTEPALRYIGEKSTPAMQFRVATSKRAQDPNTKEWRDVAECFLTVQTWRHTAENAAVSIAKGTIVDVKGYLRQRDYTTDAGEKRTVYEVIDAEVGISLSTQSAEVTKTARKNAPTTGAAKESAPQSTPPTAPPAQAGPPAGFSPAF